MTTYKESFRFSGHDTFHCKEQWILKGLQVIESQEDKSIFKKNDAIPLLGVGKNMVRSIHYWLRSFGLIDNDNNVTDFANLIFLRERLDPYLENEGSLWLLQYCLCKTNHSSIYKLIFSKYFSDKATLEFSEYQVYNFVNRLMQKHKHKVIASKTFNSDFKVFIRTYVIPTKNEKTVEDDFNAPLLGLNLVANTGRKNSINQSIFRLNLNNQESISTYVFAYCLLDHFQDEVSVSFDKIKNSVGSFLCLTNEGLEILISKLCEENKDFIYKDDAGVRQLQFKNNSVETKNNILKEYYGV